MFAPSESTICGLIVCHEKDLATLSFCINGLLTYTPCQSVYVVGNSNVEDYLRSLPAIFIHEDSLIPQVTSHLHQDGRWGWYFQQILKLGFADVCPTPRYVATDADTVFLRPVSFLNQDLKLLLATSQEHHQPYYDVFRELLDFEADPTYSFVVHHMVFDCAIVQEMVAVFEPLSPWWRNVERYLRPMKPWNSGAQFSEFETYGHYVFQRHPTACELRPLKWTIRESLPTARVLRRLSRRFDFCTFHAHFRSRSPVSRALSDFARTVRGR